MAKEEEMEEPKEESTTPLGGAKEAADVKEAVEAEAAKEPTKEDA